MNLEETSFILIKDILLAKRDDYGEIYLIGGYLRDYFLKKINKDLDFVVVQNAARAARNIADKFGGDFYMLDQQRETARSLITIENQPIIVDVALINGANIFEDLKKRDFSINAMAIDLTAPENILDPMDGRRDLQKRRLIPCSDSSFFDDPIRTLRAVRFIQSLSLNYDPQVKQTIIDASENLFNVSAERIRDELCQIFNLPEVNQSLELMVEFKLFTKLFPDLIKLKDIPPRSPHVNDAYKHTMRVVELTRAFMDSIINVPKQYENKFLNDVQLLIGKYKDHLVKFLDKLSDTYLSINSLMVMAALYHDSAKSLIPPLEDRGKVFFPDHAEKSAEIINERMKALAFSNEEIHFVKSIVRYHMSDCLKSVGEGGNPNRSIYHYFQETGYTGVLIGFLHLADLIATYEGTLSPDRWNIALKSVDKILEGWFFQFEAVVSPARLINGNDLIEKFGLQPGRELGHILEQIYEEQAAGTILERNGALDFAKKMIDGK